jgi:transcription-repair coupling factor (superfamily II helicase)
MDFSHLGAGLHLAMHDLKIRGGGNILGFAQSGQISAVGYELYLKLIEQAIAELKGEEWEEEINPEINMDIPAFLPGDYVMDTDVRLNLYRRLSGLKRASELEALVTEIKDRFGPPPEEVVNLCGVMALRIILKRLRVSRLDVGEDGLVLTFAPHPRRDPEWLLRWAQDRPAQFQFLSEYKVKIHTAPRTQPPDLVQVEHAILAVEEQSRGH